MTQPGNLPTFTLTLGHDTSPMPFFATCLVDGAREGLGFHSAVRRFSSPERLTAAFTGAGIPISHFQEAIVKIHSGKEAAFEVSQNEGQKLGILHADTSE